MAHAAIDRTGGLESREEAGRVLSRSTMTTVRRVLHGYRERWLLEPRLTMVSRMVAEDAHRHGLAAERMLVALKREWVELDEVLRLPAPDARKLLNRLVTLSIDAYYEHGHGPLPAATPSTGDRGIA